MICHSNGCNQCESGYFKVDYNYPCTHCQETFGDECLFCQDFNGCGQCAPDYNRVKDSSSGLWYCSLSDTSSTNGRVRVLLDDVSTFSGVGLEDYDEPDEDEDPPSYGVPSVIDILQDVKLLDVEDDGTQHETTFTESYLNNLLSLWYDRTLQSTAICNETDCMNDYEPSEPCDCSDYCNTTDTDPIPQRRRLGYIFNPDSMTEIESWGGIPSSKYSGRLTFTNSEGTNSMCSAALIGPRHIITAAHCFHGGKNDDWYDTCFLHCHFFFFFWTIF